MIIVETDKVWVLYVRTNRCVRWQYAEYNGRYRTAEEAIKAAKKHYRDTPFEYRIKNRATNETITGFVNWR